MTVEIDGDFIYTLLDFSKITGASWAEQENATLCDDNLDIPEPKMDEAGLAAATLEDVTYADRRIGVGDSSFRAEFLDRRVEAELLGFHKRISKNNLEETFSVFQGVEKVRTKAAGSVECPAPLQLSLIYVLEKKRNH
ncbi:Vacuolar protein sorting-associated protein 13 [Rhizina undulata]